MSELRIRVVKKTEIQRDTRRDVAVLQKRLQSSFGQQQSAFAEIFHHVMQLTEEMEMLKARIDALTQED